MSNHYDFEGRVALVTGGASGIGAATVERLQAGGAEVHIFDLANRAAIPKMKAGNYGRIVNIASIAGKEGNPMAGAYSSSKGAVIALTKATGKDVAGSGVLVNCIAPAVINTPILGQISEEHIAYMTARIPLARVGEPDEVARLVCWLASEDMSFST